METTYSVARCQVGELSRQAWILNRRRSRQAAIASDKFRRSQNCQILGYESRILFSMTFKVLYIICALWNGSWYSEIGAEFMFYTIFISWVDFGFEFSFCMQFPPPKSSMYSRDVREVPLKLCAPQVRDSFYIPAIHRPFEDTRVAGHPNPSIMLNTPIKNVALFVPIAHLAQGWIQTTATTTWAVARFSGLVFC